MSSFDLPIDADGGRQPLGLPDKEAADKPASPDVDFSDSTVCAYVTKRFQRAKDSRLVKEQEWQTDWNNYRATYTAFRSDEQSKICVPYTKVKVLAAAQLINEVLFGGNEFPLGVEADKDPIVGDPHVVHVDSDPSMRAAEADKPSLFGYSGDGRNIPPGATSNTLLGMLGTFTKAALPWAFGAGRTPSAITEFPADNSAMRMNKRMQDQLAQSNTIPELRRSIHDCALYGTAIFKGPLLAYTEQPRWRKDGDDIVYEPETIPTPEVSYVSTWSLYIDPDVTSFDKATYCIERQAWSRTAFAMAKGQPGFRDNVIDDIVENTTPNWTPQWWEAIFRAVNQNPQTPETWEVYEYWGLIETKLALAEGIVELPENMMDAPYVSVNAFVCGTRLFKLVVNPFQPAYLPYYVVPYERDNQSPYGIGVASSMAQMQILINGFLRLAVDNAAKSGNLMFEISESLTVADQDYAAYPGKIWRTQNAAGQRSVFPIETPNISQQNLMLMDQATRWADSVTLPAMVSGTQGVGTATSLRTSSGMSMLMGNANNSIRSVVNNWDDYGLQPLGTHLYWWNMQFMWDEGTQQLLRVTARGTESLMKKEVRSQRLMSFLQVGGSPAFLPFMKIEYMLREMAKTLDLDPDDAVNDLETAKKVAAILTEMGILKVTAGPQQGQPQEGGAPAPQQTDMAGLGNANISAGAATPPGNPGFTGGQPEMQG